MSFRSLLLASAAALLVFPAKAEPSLADLFFYEIALVECGVQLPEAAENALDEAQDEARLKAKLSLREAAELYRAVQVRVRADKPSVCTEQSGTDLPVEVKRTASAE